MSVPQNALFNILFSLPKSDYSYHLDPWYVHLIVVFCIWKKMYILSLYIMSILHIIKWSGILSNFAYSWLAETWFTRPHLRVSTPQMLNDGLFGVSVMSQRKRRFSRQIFAQTGEFDVHFLKTSQYTHLISRRFLLAADNAMDVSLWLKEKRKRSDSVLWQKPLHPQNNPKSNVTT